MIAMRTYRTGLAIALSLVLIAGTVAAVHIAGVSAKTHITAYFANSNGIFRGDDVLILGVPVGKIDSIEPQPERAKISFWVEEKYLLPADVNAVIQSPTLVTARTIELMPAYTGKGPRLTSNAVIPQSRTAVPVEWDDFRVQLQKLTELLKPTQPGGVSTLGALINTTADNLRGRGSDIRNAIVRLSQAFSALGDHSGDIFGTVKNLSILVSALTDSNDVLRQLNQNLAAVSGLLADDPAKIAQAVSDLDTVAGAVRSFVADNREALATTSGKLSSISQALVDSIDDIKQALHIFPNTFANFNNIYAPAQGAVTGAIGFNNFSNPLTFLCGALQAASRLGAEQSAKLCVQYLAPIFKNRQYNFPPLGLNPIVGATARPNEITYSEDWLRPDYVPPAIEPALSSPGTDQSWAAPLPQGTLPQPGLPATPPLAAEAQDGAAPPPTSTISTDPSAGLPGLMIAPGGQP